MTTTTTVLAWHGDPQLKADAVERMREHAAADRLIRGAYVDHDGDATTWRGCLHGCLTAETIAAERGISVADLIEDPDVWWHVESERLWGIPRQLGALLDRLYEALDEPPGEVAVGMLEAIPVGADLTVAADRLMLDVLVDPEHGVWRHTAEGSRQREAVERVAQLYRRRLAGDEPPEAEWRDAAADADAAAYAYAAYAAYAAADAAYAAAADAADAAYADAAAADAAYAAYAAADADAAADWWRWRHQQLLTHIHTAPTPEATP
jgi:hypothetical protein